MQSRDVMLSIVADAEAARLAHPSEGDSIDLATSWSRVLPSTPSSWPSETSSTLFDGSSVTDGCWSPRMDDLSCTDYAASLEESWHAPVDLDLACDIEPWSIDALLESIDAVRESRFAQAEIRSVADLDWFVPWERVCADSFAGSLPFFHHARHTRTHYWRASRRRRVRCVRCNARALYREALSNLRPRHEPICQTATGYNQGTTAHWAFNMFASSAQKRSTTPRTRTCICQL